MLNLKVAMVHLRFFLPLLFFPFLAWSVGIFPAQVVIDQPKVTSPRKGDVLQGLVLINGTTDISRLPPGRGGLRLPG